MSEQKELAWKDKPFDPNPRFSNHMCHWGPWAKHFENSEDSEKAMLAAMLGAACDEIDEKNRRWNKETLKFTAVFFAFIETCDRLPLWARWAIVKPKVDGGSSLFSSAWGSIKQLNKWRAENKYGIKEWDPS